MLRSSVRQRASLQQLWGCLRSVQTTAGASQQAAPAQQASDTIEVFVNDEPVQIVKGSTVLQACDAAGIDIPRCDLLLFGHLQQNADASFCRPACSFNPCCMASVSNCWRWNQAIGRLLLQVLLPPPFVNRWQLPHVPGGGELDRMQAALLRGSTLTYSFSD
jgi:hypothetical protein